ncbi:hypothetical protein ACFZC3_15560 [Streptomyces sp. NPDC007903]|uniref:hypothetical protein n=1 Tax=Streptomyces sp. NPDC007903 TaxID=3364786 RepID=UPI0036EAB384
MTSPESGPGSQPYTSERRDACTVEQWDVPSRTYRRYDCGELVEERPFNDAENSCADQALSDQARRTMQASLLDQAAADMAANQAYLDKVTAGNATTADAVAQVAALTAQAQRFIRLTVGGPLLDGGPPPPDGISFVPLSSH